MLCYTSFSRIKWLKYFMAMDSRLLKWVICCVCAGLTGCMSHHYTANNPSRRHGSDQKMLHQLKVARATFSYSPNTLKIQDTLYRKKTFRDYHIRLLKFTSVGDNGQDHDQVEAIYYKSKLPGRHKLLVVLPIYGGSKYPPAGITSTILTKSQGKINIIRVLGKNSILRIEDLEKAPTVPKFKRMLKLLAVRIKNTVIDVRRLVDWAARQKEISPQHINIIGFSKTSIIAGLITQIDPHISDAIYVMGGSNPADMLYHCDYYDIRKNITRRFHWSNKKLKSVLNGYLGPLFNVAHYPSRLDSCHVLIFESRYDKCIAKKPKDELWLGMGKPERISFYYGHQVSFGSMTFAGGYFMRYKILNFINQNNCMQKGKLLRE